jgi:chitosanase
MNDLQQKTVRAIVNIFETGRIRGNYSAIAILKGDNGHLSYGRSQATLGSGSLFQLIDLYCQQPNAKFAVQLRPFLPDLQKRDVRLDTDETFKQHLRDAGSQDPLMRETQDKFFSNNYFVPACTHAEALGIKDPLGVAVVYDSHIQGGWDRVKARVGAVVNGDVHGWVSKFVSERTLWLSSLKDPLPATVYRMKSFDSLIAANNWDLALPLKAHGVEISEAALLDEGPPTAGQSRLLTLVTPYLRGDDVQILQRALLAKGLPIGTPDRVYGPFTHQIVLEWQRRQSISENGVGPATRLSLGI